MGKFESGKHLRTGRELEVPMFESAGAGASQQAEKEISEKAFFESLDDNTMLEAVSKLSSQQDRTTAYMVVVEWLDEGDDSADALDAMIQGMADVNEDGEVNDDEQDAYQHYLTLVAEVFVSMGVSVEDATAAVKGNDDAVATAFETASAYLAESTDDDTDLAVEFAVKETMLLEAVQKVIRDGKVTYIKKRLRKRRMTAAQKAALKKARLKAHSAAGKAQRRKSMRMRKSRGM